jgi:hypothetical protein
LELRIADGEHERITHKHEAFSKYSYTRTEITLVDHISEKSFF